VKELTLIPSGGGAFEVTARGRLIYSKKQTHRHPTAKEIKEILRNQ
jgi:selenoprotein W-related protein